MESVTYAVTASPAATNECGRQESQAGAAGEQRQAAGLRHHGDEVERDRRTRDEVADECAGRGIEFLHGARRGNSYIQRAAVGQQAPGGRAGRNDVVDECASGAIETSGPATAIEGGI